jgi:hypothetical protein
MKRGDTMAYDIIFDDGCGGYIPSELIQHPRETKYKDILQGLGGIACPVEPESIDDALRTELSSYNSFIIALDDPLHGQSVETVLNKKGWEIDKKSGLYRLPSATAEPVFKQRLRLNIKEDILYDLQNQRAYMVIGTLEDAPVVKPWTKWSGMGFLAHSNLVVDGARVSRVGASSWEKVLATGGNIMTKGQHYWEIQIEGNAMDINFGAVSPEADYEARVQYRNSTSYTICTLNNGLYNGILGMGVESEKSRGRISRGDRIGAHLDLDKGKMWFDLNGKLYHPGFSNVSGPLIRAVELISGDAAVVATRY